MTLRLGFSVAAHLAPDVLIIDEVLAVGDAGFRERCHDRMRELQRAGTTILVVTHDMDEVRKFSGRAVWLHDGCVASEGPPEAVVAEYLRSYG